MNILKTSLLAFTCAAVTIGAKAELTVTELMQSNISGVMDDTNEFPDSWVELHNDGTEPINLQDYYIGLKKKVDSAYRLPDMTLEAGAYLLVYCDKGDTGMHAPFRLESNKEGNVFLFNAAGEQIQKVNHPAFPAPDIAYGLDPATGEWGYELTPTPGMPNTGGVCQADHILEAPLFSTPGRVSAEPLTLTLTLPDDAPEGTAIYYTTDGTLPTPVPGNLYTGPISITTSTAVRATTAAEGWLSPFAVTQSYIMPDHDITLPVISIATDDDYLYSDDLGIYSDHEYSDGKLNYTHDWRRPINIEFFFDHTRSDLNQLCETRISGGYTRKFAQKTFAIYANKRFGNKRFDYEMFPDQRPGLTDYPSLLLRNAGNDFISTHFRDATIQMNVAAHCDVDYQAYRPAVVFINGEYKGILNIRERSNEDNIVTNYDGLEDIHMLENWVELKAGDMQVFQDFKTFYNTPGHTAEEYEALMDVDEFFNFFVSQIYYDNNDFPYNNLVLWRPTEEGGRWRWLLKDTDAAMGLTKWQPTEPTLTRYATMQADPRFNYGTQLLFNVLENETLRQRFIDKFAVFMGDFLNLESTAKYLDANQALIKDEYPYHCALFVNEELRPEVDKAQRFVDAAKRWLGGRNEYLIGHIAEFFELGAPLGVKINQPADYDGEPVQYIINGVPVNNPVFDGHYFTDGQLNVTVPDEAKDLIKRWDYVAFTADEAQRGHLLTADFSMTMPACDRIELTPSLTVDDPTSDPDVSVGQIQTEAGAPVYYNLQGIKVERPLPGGVYIMRTGTTLRKVTKILD